MNKGRLEAFSDGVIAIIITIMVLQLTVPKEPTFAALLPLMPVFLGYLLSFVYVAIYWNNHHQLYQVVERIDGRVLWANLHLLFWLSLIPFVTAWMGESNFATLPVALYGLTLLLSAIAYFFLTRTLLRLHENDSILTVALGRDVKGKLSVVMYLAAIPLAFVATGLAGALYIAVAIIWLVPDQRIEKQLR